MPTNTWTKTTPLFIEATQFSCWCSGNVKWNEPEGDSRRKRQQHKSWVHGGGSFSIPSSHSISFPSLILIYIYITKTHTWIKKHPPGFLEPPPRRRSFLPPRRHLPALAPAAAPGEARGAAKQSPGGRGENPGERPRVKTGGGGGGGGKNARQPRGKVGKNHPGGQGK